MANLISLLERVIDSDFPVLIQGESGSGKDLVASAIHFNSRRSAMPFVSENCASLPETLLESELFGHTKGAFTGAVSDRKGLLEMAHRGTLFLDEVGDMSPGMQSKLLRFLQDGEFRPVGGAELVRVDVRIISASNRQLLELVEQGRFRQDLFFRLNVLPLTLPPLRERREDIPQLVKHFLGILCSELDRNVPEIASEVVDVLYRYDWPGNVRELENEMRRLVTLAAETISLDLVSERIRQMPDGSLKLDELEGLDLTAKVEAIERHEILEALRACRGNKSRAARKLGISRFTLQRKIEKYSLSVESSG
jgi:transcriptional regulator with PAS, ATPase and Fis domain